jgi:hypothetical protein
MPFSSLSSSSFTNLAFTGKAVAGVSSPITVEIPFTNVPTATFEEWTNLIINVIANNATLNSVLYWKIKHITTTDADFVINPYVGVSGTTSTLQYYDGNFNGTYRTYATFYLSLKNDGILEGNETFAIEIRAGSQTGPLVGTIRIITITDYL